MVGILKLANTFLWKIIKFMISLKTNKKELKKKEKKLLDKTFARIVHILYLAYSEERIREDRCLNCENKAEARGCQRGLIYVIQLLTDSYYLERQEEILTNQSKRNN